MSEVSTKYFLGNTEIIQSFVGEDPVLFDPFPPPPYPIPLDGLIMFLDGTQNMDTSSGYWYNSYGGNVTASLFGSPTWDSENGVLSISNVQGFFTTPRPGPIDLRFTPEYTVIYGGRYSGSVEDKHGRILTSQIHNPFGGPTFLLNNWTLGNYSGSYAGLPSTGPAYLAPDPVNGKFVFPPSGSYDTNWRVFGAVCEFTESGVSDIRKQRFFLNGEFITASLPSSSLYPAGPWGLSINTGSFTDGATSSPTFENSNCEVSDILVYNRTLSDAEVQLVSQFLADRVSI
jgi:hypothetical protein